MARSGATLRYANGALYKKHENSKGIDTRYRLFSARPFVGGSGRFNSLILPLSISRQDPSLSMSSSCRLLLSLAMVALVITSNSCTTKEKKKIAEDAVNNFHVLFNDSRYGEIYLQADQTYRDAVSETDSNALFVLLRQKLGRVEQTKQVGWSRNSSTLGTTVRLEYKTDFANGPATCRTRSGTSCSSKRRNEGDPWL